MSKIYKDQEDRAIWDDYDPRSMTEMFSLRE